MKAAVKTRHLTKNFSVHVEMAYERSTFNESDENGGVVCEMGLQALE